MQFGGIGGATLHGWIALPEAREGRALAFLWLPAYGLESQLPNEYSTRPGVVSMSFNPHGRPAFHREPYKPSQGYFAEGIEDPRTWIFRSMAQNCLVATRVLQAQLEADEDRLAACGLSQGAGMAIWAATNSPRIKAVTADLPFLAAMRHTLARPVYRYPLKEATDYAATIPLGTERILHTISYFDTVNHATRLQVPTHVGLGKRDPQCRPETVRAAYDAIPVQKRLIEYDSGHDWNPKMVENNTDWLLEHLK